LAASCTIDVGGHALCTFHRIGVWAVAGVGVLYEPAKNARRAMRTANATADLKGICRRMGIPPWG
jgi:hypothetical protein